MLAGSRCDGLDVADAAGRGGLHHREVSTRHHVQVATKDESHLLQPPQDLGGVRRRTEQSRTAQW